MLLREKVPIPAAPSMTAVSSMDNQQSNSESIKSTGILNEGFATLFFMMGALHVYGAMRSRQTEVILLTKSAISRCFQLAVLTVTLLGMIEILAF